MAWPRHCPAQNDLSWKLHIRPSGEAAEQANLQGYRIQTRFFRGAKRIELRLVPSNGVVWYQKLLKPF